MNVSYLEFIALGDPNGHQEQNRTRNGGGTDGSTQAEATESLIAPEGSCVAYKQPYMTDKAASK